MRWIRWVVPFAAAVYLGGCFRAEASEKKNMVVEYIRYEVPKERAAAFLAAYQEAGKHLQRSPHCLRFETSHCVEEPTQFVVRIEWDSIEGHEKGFRSSPEFRDFFALVKPYFGDIREMRHYQVTSAGTGGQK